MRLVRTFFHALLILTGMVILDTITKKVQGLQLVLGLVRTGHFFLFSFSAAAALNRQRLLIPVVLLLAVLILYPLSMDALVSILVTTTLGVLLGAALQGLIHEGTNAPPNQPRADRNGRPPADLDQRPRN